MINLSTDFWFGFAAGMIVAAVIGWGLWQLRSVRLKVQMMTSPQRVIVKSNQSPWQVVGAAVRAGCAVLFIVAIIVLIVLALVARR